MKNIKAKKWLLQAIAGVALAFQAGSVSAQAAPPIIVGIGDSIGEGVQAADASWQTQPFTYLNLLSHMVGGDLSLPYIDSGFFGVVGDTSNRSRLFPNEITTNVAVSGATVSSLINERPVATNTAQISTEAELVLFPRLQTQLEYVESSNPLLVVCWIGNNDVLSAATSFANLNASQLTPVTAFDQSFTELATRLGALVQNNGTIVLFGNIPDVTDIGFLVDRAAAESITGFPVNLPDGQFTSIIGALLMSFLGNDSLLNDPGFVLDQNELAQIQQRIQTFNAIIQREANRIGMPLVDVNARFAEIQATPPTFLGNPVSKEILGGLFSLDGVHPSNLGHALLANEFVSTINNSYGTSFPLFSQESLELYYLTDPSIDKDGDGRATGRLGAGLIETLAFFFGMTGDANDFSPN